jgi:hypothetical protein
MKLRSQATRSEARRNLSITDCRSSSEHPPRGATMTCEVIAVRQRAAHTGVEAIRLNQQNRTPP